MISPAARKAMSALAVISLVAGTFAIANPRRPRVDTISVTAYFAKAIGLFPDSDVRVLGVAVGKVTSVTPDGPRVKVILEIDKSRKIPANARAAIIPISLISDRYIQLAPVYTSGPLLEDGDVLDLDRTSIPVELDDVLAQLKKFLDAVEAGSQQDPGALGDAVKNAAGALQGAGEDLGKTLSGAGAVSFAVAEQAVELDSLVVHLARLLEALAQRRTEINKLNARLADSLGAIAAERAALDGTLTNLALLTEQLGSLIKDHRPNLEADLRILSNTTQAVIRHQDSLIRANDWLHVIADGAEEAHNGGAVHSNSGAGAPVHVDVRDAHGFMCPSPSPVVCLLLGLSGASSTPALPTGAPAGKSPRLLNPGTEQQETEAQDPLDILRILPSPEITPSVPGATASGRTPPTASVPKASLVETLSGWFQKLGGLVDRAVRWFS